MSTVHWLYIFQQLQCHSDNCTFDLFLYAFSVVEMHAYYLYIGCVVFPFWCELANSKTCDCLSAWGLKLLFWRAMSLTLGLAECSSQAPSSYDSFSEWLSELCCMSLGFLCICARLSLNLLPKASLLPYGLNLRKYTESNMSWIFFMRASLYSLVSVNLSSMHVLANILVESSTLYYTKGL